MSTPGPWLEDATIEWHDTAFTRTPSRFQQSFGQGATWQDAATAAWAATPSDVTTDNLAGELILSDGPSFASATWRASWLTLTRTGDGGNTVASTTLPPTSPYYTDANVVGIEWETATTPVTQRLTVRIQNSTTQSTVLGTSPETHTIKTAPGYGSLSPYTPPGQTRATLLGMSTLGTITTPASVDLTVTEPAGVPLAGDFSLPIAALDPYTFSGTAPAHSGSAFNRRYPIRATLEGGYRPLYRVLYDAPPPVTVAVRKVVRLFPRDGDGYGF